MYATPSTKAAATESWPITVARVVSCQYQYAKFQNVSFANETHELSVPDGSSFLVTFSYKVNGELFVDDFDAQTNYAEGYEFEIGYDPSNPQINTYSKSVDSPRRQIFTWIVVGILVALLVYLSEKYEFH